MVVIGDIDIVPVPANVYTPNLIVSDEVTGIDNVPISCIPVAVVNTSTVATVILLTIKSTVVCTLAVFA